MRGSRRSSAAILAVSAALVVGAGAGYANQQRSAGSTEISVGAYERPRYSASVPASPTPGAGSQQIPRQDAAPPTPATSVAPPVRVRVAAVGIDAPVDPVGVAPDGQMALPDDPNRLGWYRFGAAPGSDNGSAVLAGHVDSRRFGVGQLAQLERVRPGERVLVSLADGRDAEFEIVSVQQIRKRALPLDELFDRSGPARLTLVTCGGRYLPDAGGYEDNLVVTAIPRPVGASGKPIPERSR